MSDRKIWIVSFCTADKSDQAECVFDDWNDWMDFTRRIPEGVFIIQVIERTIVSSQKALEIANAMPEEEDQ